MLQNRNWLGFGPIRARRLAFSVVVPIPYSRPEEWPNVFVRNIFLLLAVACFLRLMMTGLRHSEGHLIVENLFRRVTVDIGDVVSIRFEARGLSAAKRLIIEDGTGRKVAATGVSIWVFPILLPWQRPDKRLLQLHRFLTQANVIELYRAP